MSLLSAVFPPTQGLGGRPVPGKRQPPGLSAGVRLSRRCSGALPLPRQQGRQVGLFFSEPVQGSQAGRQFRRRYGLESHLAADGPWAAGAWGLAESKINKYPRALFQGLQRAVGSLGIMASAGD